MPVLIGLDVGTTALKGISIDEQGRVLARHELPYPLRTPRPGWAEQDPDDWWRATREVLARLTADAGPPAGIGLSGQMHGLVALDEGDRVLRPAILWNDQRTARECEEIERMLSRERLIELTGNLALPGFTAPKLLWLRRHEPDAYGALRRMLLPKDYVRLRLCGEHATDVADASGTLLLDVARRAWSEDMLAALQIDPGILPEVHESPEVAGEARLEGRLVPVAAGAGDQAAGALGVGVARPGALSVVLGTSGVVFAAADSHEADPQGRLHAFCHARPGGWHVMGVMLSAAGALEWARAALAPERSFEELLDEAARVPAGADGVLFLPYLSGERTPYADPDARGAFAGLALGQERGVLVRAVLEGVAYGLRDCLELVREREIETPVGRVSGGGAHSDLWLSIVASALEVPLERVAVAEGAAFGAALLGGVACGAWADVEQAIAATVRPAGRIEPLQEWTEAYREGHARYRALYPALRSAREA